MGGGVRRRELLKRTVAGGLGFVGLTDIRARASPSATGDAASSRSVDGERSSSGPDRYVVGVDPAEEGIVVRQSATRIVRELDFEEFGRAVVGEFSEEIVRRLERRPEVRYVETETVKKASGESPRWSVGQIGADIAHETGVTGEGTDVAILDTGIDSNHPDLGGEIGEGHAVIACGSDREGTACGDTSGECIRPWDDDEGHGTHVAGTVAASPDSTEVVGVAPDATLHSVKALDCSGVGYGSDIAAGIKLVADEGWDVANLSLVGSGSNAVRDAVRYAYKRGVFMTAAAGNEGRTGVQFPAAYREVVAVGATTDSGEIAGYSNSGPAVELVAPGGGDTDGDGLEYSESVVSTFPAGDSDGYGYLGYTGTSMASAHVAGGAALLLSEGYNHATNVEYSSTGRLLTSSYTDPGGAREQLRADARDVGATRVQQGYGLIDVGRVGVAEQLLTVESPDGARREYGFEVGGHIWKATKRGGSVNSNDTVQGSTVAGSVRGGTDSYTYSGSLERFAGEDVTVYFEGWEADPAMHVRTHTITVQSDDDTSRNYEFSVGGSLSKSGALSASVNGNDAVNGTTASGTVGNGRDSYTYTGPLERFAGEDVTVYLDGSEVDPATVVDTHTVTIASADGHSQYYELSVGDSLSKSEALSAAVNDNDTVDRTSAFGTVGSGRDSYTYTGSLERFAGEDVTVYLDGRRRDLP